MNGLLEKVVRHGGVLRLEYGKVRCRSSRPLPPPLMSELRAHREELVERLQADRRNRKAWLDGAGRLRMIKVLPEDCTMLEILVGLDASVEEIERHVQPIGTPEQWFEWTGEKVGYWRE